MFKAGYILKVKVEDFVTYSSAKIYPGPQLNMIIGPNGSGKSTIVAAIILGLGGNPKTVGRGHKVSDYIKHNRNEAKIKVVLQGASPNDKITIQRHINKDDKSTWYLNRKTVLLKDVQAVIKTFNIQVDNLCQFLPQDKVQDFAKLNKQQLLEQMQIAICRQDLLETQRQLIDNCKGVKNLRETITKDAQKLEEYEQANGLLEGRMQGLMKKRKYLSKLEHVERKILWLNYEVLMAKRDEIKQDKAKAAEIFKRNQEAYAPMENNLKKAKQTYGIYQKKLGTLDSTKNTIQNNLQSLFDKHDQTKDSIHRISDDLNYRLEQYDQKQEEIQLLRTELDDLNQKKTELIAKITDVGIEKKLAVSKQSALRVSNEIGTLTESKRALVDRKRQHSYQLRSIQNELEKLDNVKQQRLDWLSRTDKDAYSAVLWLRNNQQIFKGRVYEPMILELNVLNSKYSLYIENTIPMRDRVAFTCVYKEDMQLLIDSVRVHQNLVVNVLYSGEDQPGTDQYQPPVPIENLKEFGLHTYIKSLLIGPEPIMKYLCKTYHIHRIPVGNRITDAKYLQIPPQFTIFYSDTARFSVSRSRYTGEKSVRRIEIASDGSLATSVDVTRMGVLQKQHEDLRLSCEKYDEQISSVDAKIGTLNEQLAKINTETRVFKNGKQEVHMMDSKIRLTSIKLDQLLADNVSPETMRQTTETKIRGLVEKIVALQTEIKNVYEKLSNLMIDMEKSDKYVQVSRTEVTVLENQIYDVKRSVDVSRETLERISEILSNATKEAKIALQKAKAKSKDTVPTDPEFDEFRDEYDSLPNNLDELEEEKQRIVVKIDHSRAADANEIREYEDRKQKIDKLRDRINAMNGEVDGNEQNMEALQNSWLEPIQEIVGKINEKFGIAFENLNCVGEVTIYKGDNEKDFTNYGLSVKVKFRQSEPLQELNGITQSGGERAVATAAFMLSLQELTPVPFRCVDEINQGMDAGNEKKIFEVLVDITTRADTSQYFFITPKLIPNLNYVPGMKVHIVFNGPFITNEKSWKRVSQDYFS